MPHPPRPEPTFLGYILKRVARRPQWLSAPGVELVCSVSNCMSPEPPGKFDRWNFNAAGCYDSEQRALATVNAADAVQYTRFGLALFPLEFQYGQASPIPVGEFLGAEVTTLPQGPSAGYSFLGYDATSGRRAKPAGDGYAAVMAAFDCSPLSCNHLAAQNSANRYCLMDSWERAVNAATAFSLGGAEPGPYYILSVYAAEPIVPNDVG